MIWRRTVLSIVLALTLSFLVVGCGSDSTEPATPPADFSGNWDIDFEVISKATCNRDVGDMDNGQIVITQAGNRATLIVDNTLAVELTVNGSKASGSSTGETAMNVDLTIANGELGGTIAFTDTKVPCTEVLSLTGTRSNAAPSSDFAGNWDLDITVTDSACKGETVGSMEQVCRAITVDGSTVSIIDEDGPIEGVGDGNTTVLRRIEDDGRLSVELTVSGNSLSGRVLFYDTEDQCEVVSTLTGTKRSEPCPPPPPQGDFEGSWDMAIRVTTSNCPDEEPGDNFVACMLATVEGSDISLEDGSSEGPITGEIDGNTALLSRTSKTGVLTVSIEIDGDEVFGSAMMNYTSGNCAETTVEYALDGLRRSGPCGSGSGGAFEGYWNVTGEFITNGCGFSLQPTCSQFLQSGDTVTIVNDGLQGTVSGDVLTIHREETVETTVFTIDIVLEISNDGNSFAGTQTLTLENKENPEESCTSSANMSGIRTTGCDPMSQGLRIKVPALDR